MLQHRARQLARSIHGVEEQLHGVRTVGAPVTSDTRKARNVISIDDDDENKVGVVQPTTKKQRKSFI